MCYLGNTTCSMAFSCLLWYWHSKWRSIRARHQLELLSLQQGTTYSSRDFSAAVVLSVASCCRRRQGWRCLLSCHYSCSSLQCFFYVWQSAMVSHLPDLVSGFSLMYLMQCVAYWLSSLYKPEVVQVIILTLAELLWDFTPRKWAFHSKIVIGHTRWHPHCIDACS